MVLLGERSLSQNRLVGDVNSNFQANLTIRLRDMRLRQSCDLCFNAEILHERCIFKNQITNAMTDHSETAATDYTTSFMLISLNKTTSSRENVND